MWVLGLRLQVQGRWHDKAPPVSVAGQPPPPPARQPPPTPTTPPKQHVASDNLVGFSLSKAEQKNVAIVTVKELKITS